MFSLIPPPPPPPPPPPSYICEYVCVRLCAYISLFLPECAYTTIIDISPRIFSLMYCCCVSIIIVICICPPEALIWLINLFLFLYIIVIVLVPKVKVHGFDPRRSTQTRDYTVCVFCFFFSFIFQRMDLAAFMSG